ncbi:hypothetical protein EA797_05905 [Stutzerimonas zhaodongensis]|uniref:Uncharacterized protein n=1 Tax=Stutzerimonas zhaodongensis TaxID=1176257 RepID=A0A3M2HWQ9_9GAMM|nr:hypothetical protein EA797_05905 [Stutzerimonas zhaodongensis]
MPTDEIHAVSTAVWPALARLTALIASEPPGVISQLIDNGSLFHEGVLTQIKRAYESSVCHANAVSPVYRVGGCRFTGNGDGLQADDVRHVTFSFHTVEIS